MKNDLEEELALIGLISQSTIGIPPPSECEDNEREEEDMDVPRNDKRDFGAEYRYKTLVNSKRENL